MAKTYKNDGNIVYASYHNGTEWVEIGGFETIMVDTSDCATDSERTKKVESIVGREVSVVCDANIPDAYDYMFENIYKGWLRKHFKYLNWN